MSNSLSGLNDPLRNNSPMITIMEMTIKKLANVLNGANIFRFFIKQNKISGNRMIAINICTLRLFDG